MVRSPRALCLADTHSNPNALRRLDDRLSAMRGEIDLVLAAGDITIAGHEPYAQEFLDCVARHGVPLLLVHGNNDSRRVVELFRRAGVTLHRQARELLGHRFVGFGGDGNAPHDVELAEGELEDLPLEGSIFLTHIPPGYPLRLSPADRPDAPRAFEFGGQLTSGGPRVHLCGHIHHTEGVGYYAGTKIVKLRAAMYDRCALLDLATLAVDFVPLGP
ncbi:MAG TPA: metallophosphoesterase [Chloroflexota bacterium]|nr:metallophosphoesterase [Chloroflexota bacterium]